MDNETRHLDMRGARVPGAPPAPPAAPAAPVPPAPAGVPTSYLPAMPQAAPVNPGYAPPAPNPGYAPQPAYAPPAANTAYTAPAAPPVYGAPPAQPGYAPPAPNGGYGNAYNYNVSPPAPGYGPAYGPPYAPLPSGPVPGATYGQTYSYNAPAPPVSVPVRRRPDSIWPFVLLGLGLFFFSGSLHLSVGAAIPLAIGLVFLYAARQNPRPGARRGLEIPGYLLTGLGAGVLLDATTRFGPDGFAALGLGLGFAALWLRDRTQWWWLIPGAVVGLAGLDDVLNSSYRGGGILLPLALLIFGLAFLTRRRGQAHV